MKCHFTKIATVLLLVSIVLMPVSTHLKSISINFGNYVYQKSIEIADRHPGKDLAPGLGVGMMLASYWPFVGIIQIVIVFLFIMSIFLLRYVKQNHNKYIQWVIYAVFAAFCLLGVRMYSSSILDDFRWNFFFSAFAEFVTLIGFAMGAFGMFTEMFRSR